MSDRQRRTNSHVVGQTFESCWIRSSASRRLRFSVSHSCRLAVRSSVIERSRSSLLEPRTHLRTSPGLQLHPALTHFELFLRLSRHCAPCRRELTLLTRSRAGLLLPFVGALRVRRLETASHALLPRDPKYNLYPISFRRPKPTQARCGDCCRSASRQPASASLP